MHTNLVAERKEEDIVSELLLLRNQYDDELISLFEDEECPYFLRFQAL